MDGHVDRISYLPTSIIFMILTLLPFKEAVRTSVLSTRWRTQWHRTMDVELDEKSFLQEDIQRALISHGRNAFARGIHSTGRKLFLKFCNNWFGLERNERINRLRLRISKPNSITSEIESWIRDSINRNVKEIVLDFFYDLYSSPSNPNSSQFVLPDLIYEHRDLLDLRMSFCNFEPTRFSSFISLRNLYIEGSELTHEMLNTLITSCSSLENLYLKKCRGFKTIKMESEISILNLTMDNCYLEHGYLEVNAPSLKSFKYFGFHESLILHDMTKLTHVEFNFEIQKRVADVSGELLCQLLQTLLFVESLTVCSYCTQVVACGFEPFKMESLMGNVLDLTMNVALDPDELPGVAFLIRSCPFLRSLTIKMGTKANLVGYRYPLQKVLDGKIFWNHVTPIRCLKKSLIMLKIENFKNTDNEYALIQIVLKKALNLKKLIIETKNKDDPSQNTTVCRIISQWIFSYRDKTSPVDFIFKSA